MGRAAKAKFIKQMTLSQLEAAFPDEESCQRYLMNRRWPDGVRCPRCGHDGVAVAAHYKPFYWQCRNCSPNGYRFSVTVGTVFESTNAPLRTWFRVIHLTLTNKSGISSRKIYRMGVTGSRHTAWYMSRRIRAGMQDREFRKLIGA